MWTRRNGYTWKRKELWLTFLVFMLVFIIVATFWTQEFEDQQENIYTLSPYPQNQMLDYETTLCWSSNTPIKPPPHNNIRCPQNPIVTVRQLGRLGNQMYEYISVWAIAKKTGREPYVPSCLIQELGKIFRNLTVPPLSYLAYCTVEKYPVPVTADKVEHLKGSILLPTFAQFAEYVAPFLSEIRQIFQFKQNIVDESQKLLHNASRGAQNITYVGVHVRRADYQAQLNLWYDAAMVKPDFFLRQMDVFRNKYKSVMFVVLSDDPEWCERELRGDDVVVMRNDSPEQDLAIMAACNHSIIDYGSYGMWGAILAGGDTFVYNLTKAYDPAYNLTKACDPAYEMALLLPNWHIVT